MSLSMPPGRRSGWGPRRGDPLQKGQGNMPAYEDEIVEAEKEGVQIHTLVIPKRVVAKKGRVTGIECVRATLGSFDGSGRRKPEVITGSESLCPLI